MTLVSGYTCAGFSPGNPPRRIGVEEPRNERCDRSRHDTSRSPLMAMEQYLYLIPLLPLLAFVVNLLFGRFLRAAAHWIATPSVFASFLLSLLVFRQISATGEPLRQDLYTWIQSGTFHIGINLFVDQLTAVMLIVVTSVGFLVHVYSKGYMHGDPGFARFFAYLPFFVFSMLMLVLADNFLLLFFFWEGVGLASYLLIGFWFTRRSAAGAAQKAFIVNRIGDLAFGLGVIWVFYQFGTLEFAEVFAQVPAAPVGVVTGIALLLFGGAAGKSAQFPLHVWLPDAMEGPTPVSALIHAATMVTAGVYLIARMHPLFEQAPAAADVGAIIGCLTLLIAATIGLVVTDLKRVIAYSTMSQIGYMVMGVSSAAYAAGLFHLMTHAFFKALLFMAAGSVIAAMAGMQNLDKMGGFRRAMPFTYGCFLVGGLALSGVFPFSGLFSKDEVLSLEFDRGGWHVILGVLGYVGSFMTAVYTFRMIFRAFHGEPVAEARELEHGHLAHHDVPTNPATGEEEDTDVGFPGPDHHIAEREAPMKIAMGVLAIGAAGLGVLQIPGVTSVLHDFLKPTFEDSRFYDTLEPSDASSW